MSNAAKIYRGYRQLPEGYVAQFSVSSVVGGKSKPLNPRLDLFNHSPSGFEWGYHGSGPAQLALAILADFTGDDRLAVRLHQYFKSDVIAQQDPKGDFWLAEDTVKNWLAKRSTLVV